MADDAVTPSREIVTRAEARAAGLKRYYTGKPCRHGHVDYRYVCDHACFECARQKATRQRAANPEISRKVTARNTARYRTDPEFRAKRIAQAADWVARNPERAKAQQSAHYQANKEERLAQSKALRAKKLKDPAWVEKERARKRAQHKKNPESKRSHVRKRRAALRGAEGTHNAKDIKALLERQKHKCPYCSSGLREGYEVDHITPISRGGSNWPRNLQILCKPCNRSKWCKDPIDFAQEKGRLL